MKITGQKGHQNQMVGVICAQGLSNPCEYFSNILDKLDKKAKKLNCYEISLKCNKIGSKLNLIYLNLPCHTVSCPYTMQVNLITIQVL